jgi:hypothetical protein
MQNRQLTTDNRSSDPFEWRVIGCLPVRYTQTGQSFIFNSAGRRFLMGLKAMQSEWRDTVIRACSPDLKGKATARSN